MKDVVGTFTHELQCSTGFDQVTRNRLANEDSLQEAALSLNLKSGCLHWSKITCLLILTLVINPRIYFLKNLVDTRKPLKEILF